MGIEWVLTRQKCAEKQCATLWDPRAPDLVSQNSQILNFHDFRHSWKVTSSPDGPWTSKWVLGFSPKARGCRSGGLRRKYILKNDPQQKDVLENWETLSFRENVYLVMPFYGLFSPHPHPTPFQFRFPMACQGPSQLSVASQDGQHNL